MKQIGRTKEIASLEYNELLRVPTYNIKSHNVFSLKKLHLHPSHSFT